MVEETTDMLEETPATSDAALSEQGSPRNSGAAPAGKAPLFISDEELDLDTVFDVPIEVTVVLGQTTMPISELLNLGSGSVIELERKIGEPVDVYVNDRLVARGEVVIVEDHIGITMTEIIKVDKAKEA